MQRRVARVDVPNRALACQSAPTLLIKAPSRKPKASIDNFHSPIQSCIL